MQEQAAQAVEQAQLIALLFKILQFVILLVFSVFGWWVRNEFRKSEEKEKIATKERQENADKFVKYKEEQAKIIADMQSDLRSNTESDGNISNILEDFKGWFDDMKKTMDQLVVDVQILLTKK